MQVVLVVYAGNGIGWGRRLWAVINSVVGNQYYQGLSFCDLSMQAWCRRFEYQSCSSYTMPICSVCILCEHTQYTPTSFHPARL